MMANEHERYKYATITKATKQNDLKKLKTSDKEVQKTKKEIQNNYKQM